MQLHRQPSKPKIPSFPLLNHHHHNHHDGHGRRHQPPSPVSRRRMSKVGSRSVGCSTPHAPTEQHPLISLDSSDVHGMVRCHHRPHPDQEDEKTRDTSATSHIPNTAHSRNSHPFYVHAAIARAVRRRIKRSAFWGDTNQKSPPAALQMHSASSRPARPAQPTDQR